jgi:large-conductance mechanosensitive channel
MKLPFSGLLAEFKEFAFKGNMIELAVAVIIGGAFGTVVTSLTQDVIMPTIGYVINKGEQAAATVKDTATHAVAAVAAKTGITSQPSTEPTSQPTSQPTALAGTPGSPTLGPTPAPLAPAPLHALTDAKADSQQGVTQEVAVLNAVLADHDAKAEAKADADAKTKAVADAKAKATEPIKIDLMIGPIPVGKFIGSLLNFLIVAFAVFIMVVKLMGSVMKKMSKPAAPGEPTTRECPECLSIIPIKAKRCSHCTAVIVPPAGV